MCRIHRTSSFNWNIPISYLSIKPITIDVFFCSVNFPWQHGCCSLWKMLEGYTDEVGLAICKQDFSLRWVFDGFSVLVQTCGPLNVILVHFPLVLLEGMGRTANPFSGKVGETVISHHAGENTDMMVGCHERRGLRTKPRQYGRFSQMTLSNAFSWMKMLEFWLKFHWGMFLRVQLTIFQYWFR